MDRSPGERSSKDRTSEGGGADEHDANAHGPREPRPSLMATARGIINAASNLVRVGRVRRAVESGDLEPLELLPHRGYGTAQVLRLQARVLEARGITPGTTTDAWWRNLAAAYRRFTSSEIPGAIVRATVAGHTIEHTADAEGYVRFEVDNPWPDRAGWHDIDLELVAPLGQNQDRVLATAHVLVPDPSATIGIISDIDDTILQTGLTDTTTMLRTTLLHNASTRVPHPGVAAFYRALIDGDGSHERPIFFVSGSPWNLYDLITEFMDIQDIPRGPLFLKDWGIDHNKFIREDTHTYKVDRITRLLDAYPDLRFVLIGDSGQEDPEIYSDVINRFPDRIAAVYIRDVTTDPARDDAVRALLDTLDHHDVPSAFGPSTLSAAVSAAELDLITDDALEATRRAVDATAHGG